jgi:hypothetical protein
VLGEILALIDERILRAQPVPGELILWQVLSAM